MRSTMRIVKLIDKISERTGTLAAWLVIPLMVVVIIDVFQRHVLNNPTHWGYDVLWMLFSAQFLLGGAFTLLRKGHIRIDIVYGVLSDRAKVIYDIINTLVIILPPMILLTWAGIVFATDAWVSGEKLSTTNWFFPAGPSKSLIPIGFFLLALQCVAEIIRNIYQLKKNNQ
jgi:TRAP-type mannitol/chloroaromatic compound transport system permease small subunit